MRSLLHFVDMLYVNTYSYDRTIIAMHTTIISVAVNKPSAQQKTKQTTSDCCLFACSPSQFPSFNIFNRHNRKSNFSHVPLHVAQSFTALLYYIYRGTLNAHWMHTHARTRQSEEESSSLWRSFVRPRGENNKTEIVCRTRPYTQVSYCVSRYLSSTNVHQLWTMLGTRAQQNTIEPTCVCVYDYVTCIHTKNVQHAYLVCTQMRVWVICKNADHAQDAGISHDVRWYWFRKSPALYDHHIRTIGVINRNHIRFALLGMYKKKKRKLKHTHTTSRRSQLANHQPPAATITPAISTRVCRVCIVYLHARLRDTWERSRYNALVSRERIAHTYLLYTEHEKLSLGNGILYYIVRYIGR